MFTNWYDGIMTLLSQYTLMVAYYRTPYASDLRDAFAQPSFCSALRYSFADRWTFT